MTQVNTGGNGILNDAMVTKMYANKGKAEEAGKDAGTMLWVLPKPGFLQSDSDKAAILNAQDFQNQMNATLKKLQEVLDKAYEPIRI